MFNYCAAYRKSGGYETIKSKRFEVKLDYTNQYFLILFYNLFSTLSSTSFNYSHYVTRRKTKQLALFWTDETPSRRSTLVRNDSRLRMWTLCHKASKGRRPTKIKGRSEMTINNMMTSMSLNCPTATRRQYIISQ